MENTMSNKTILNLSTANYFATSESNCFGYDPSFEISALPEDGPGVAVVVSVSEGKVIGIRYNPNGEISDVHFEVALHSVEPHVVAAAIAYAAKCAVSEIAGDIDTAIDTDSVARILAAAHGEVGPGR
jgi:hypothetical protein